MLLGEMEKRKMFLGRLGEELHQVEGVEGRDADIGFGDGKVSTGGGSPTCRGDGLGVIYVGTGPQVW